MKRKVALEQYSIQQSTIQYQKWKIHYQSKMLTQEHSRRTRYAHFGSEKLFLPLKVPNHFAPNRESKKRRLSPTLQFQSIITQNEDFEQHPDSTLEALQVPSIFSRSPDPTELLRQMTTQLLPRARIPGARTKIDS